jgi:hypothetical protein
MERYLSESDPYKRFLVVGSGDNTVNGYAQQVAQTGAGQQTLFNLPAQQRGNSSPFLLFSFWKLSCAPEGPRM